MESEVRPPKRLCVMEGIASTSDITDEFADYDVFISHRGPDTKTGFVSFLYKELVEAGLQPFLDCKSIPSGENSWECIKHAIKKTPIVVVIFSESFAQSEWCLRELHVMLHSPGVKVLPIFYKVRPSEVSFPESGQLKDGFEKLTQRHNKTTIEQWRGDLKEASNLMGWEHSDAHERLEGELVKEVVEKVFELANKPLPLDVGEYVIGVKGVAHKIIETLDYRKRVLMLGLWGMGGIGKSTLARELYNQLGKRFAAKCYVEDVTEKVNQGGVVKVQNRILKALCKVESREIEDKSEGIIILEERLCNKQILLVLDDVRDNDEVDYWISRKMLTKGSMCIVTSRNRRVFEKSNSFDINHEICIHDVQLLSREDSNQVFTSYAFGGYWKVKPRFAKLVADISKACGGVPLVLKVCGALLKDEEDMDIWNEVKTKLTGGTIMDENKIFECLRISYDSLQRDYQEMFLDIACALLGESNDMAKRVWKSQGWCAALGVRSLSEKALITVDDNGCFSMHDHLRDMGREIVRKKRAAEGVVRRVWMPESLTLLEEEERLPDSLQTCVISPSSYFMRRDGSRTIDLNVSHIKDLRVLICNRIVNLTSSLPKNLRWLDWRSRHAYSYRGNTFLGIFSTASRNNKLVILNFGSSSIESLPESFGEPSNLEVLYLIDCKELILPPDLFRDLRNLRELNFAHSGIQSFPASFGELSNLEVLNLGHCKQLVTLPDSFGNLRNLRTLDLSWTGLKSLPKSFGGLSNLQDLDLYCCWDLKALPESFTQLRNLRKLNLQYCSASLSFIFMGHLMPDDCEVKL